MMAEVGDITLRQVNLAFPRGGSYDAGDDAELTMAIVNTGDEADTLISVEGEGFGDAEISGTASEPGLNGLSRELRMLIMLSTRPSAIMLSPR